MRKLAIFSFSFAIASALYVYLLPSVPALCVGAMVLLAGVVFCFFQTDVARRARIVSFGLVLGILWTWGYEQLKIEPVRSFCGEKRQIEVEICEEPEPVQYGCRVVAKLDSGKILLYLDAPVDAVSLGDRLRLCADVRDISRGSGDEESLYYQSKDIYLLGFQNGKLEVAHPSRMPLRYWPKLATIAMRDKVTELFQENAEGFARALLTGDRSGLSYEVRNALSVTGISHVVAVSGMHISLLCGMVLTLCFRRRRLAAVISILVMLFFDAMLGFAPSVTRAVIMNSVLLLAPFFNRENDVPTSLGFALLVILVYHPWSIANLSLQLSFGAVAGILLFTARLEKWLQRRLRMDALQEKHRLLSAFGKSILLIFATTLGASVFTVPLTAAAFGMVSVISPFTNLLTLTLLSGCFSLGCFAVLCGFIWLPLGKGMAWLLSWLIRGVLSIVAMLAKIPYAAVYTDSIYVVAWLVTVYLMLAVFLLQKKKRLAQFCMLTLFTFLCALFFSGLSDGAEISVTALDVGQGQCILLRSGGMTALVDCGGTRGDENGEVVARRLLMSGESCVDVLILTHFDSDHVCGAEQLMSRIEVARLVIPDIGDDTGNRERVLDAARRNDVPVLFVTEDIDLRFSGGRLCLFAPVSVGDDNAGLSALMSVGEYDILVTGDMDSADERRLLATHDLPLVEVLIAGHHGSKYSTCAELLDIVQPQIVLISVGKNSYGHPAQEMLDRVSDVGAQVYRTDLDGDITITR